MSYIETITGRKIDFLNPDPEQINIFDIAHGLSRTPRFAGHTDVEWNVAGHSCAVAILAGRFEKPENRAVVVEALLHDATEAYMGDLPSPLKRLCVDYTTWEHQLDRVIRKKYGLPVLQHDYVRLADQWALEEERKVFTPRSTWSLPAAVPAPAYLAELLQLWPNGMDSYRARGLFLEYFSIYCDDQFQEEAKWAIGRHLLK